MKNLTNPNVFSFFGKTKGSSKRVVFPLVLLLFSIYGKADAQCPAGNAFFSTQAQIDDFIIDYPDCTALPGHLTITGTDINNLNGLNNLTSIGGDLRIEGNTVLTTLDGLNLTSVTGYVGVLTNPQLTDILALQTIDPATITGVLAITDNPLLSVCNLPNFCTYLANPVTTHPRTISGNLENCVNETAVGLACGFDCPIGNFMFFAQQEIDQFIIDYPNCTALPDNLFIYANSNITNLDGLSNLTNIGGMLYIAYNGLLTNLNGLSNLTSIGGALYITGNTVLSDIEGLTNIDTESIADLHITNNAALSVCNMLNLCVYLSGDPITHPRTISGNLANCLDETAVTAACSAPCPTGNYTFSSQAQIDDFGAMYAHCTDIELGDVTISGSDITNLDGLSKITNITGFLRITENTVLTNLDGLENIETIGGYLYIDINAVLTHIDGFSNLESIGGFVSIYLNPQLTNLDGLSSLESVGTDFHIDSNAILTNLDGLSNLTQIGGQLYIKANPALTDISGLTNIDPQTIGGTWGLYIVDNTALSVCNLPNFCAYLSDQNNTRIISGNLENCVNETAVGLACGFDCPTGNYIFTTQQEINQFIIDYPNCTTVTGLLGISGNAVLDLLPLSNITSVTGNVHISDIYANDLNGLHNIQTIGGDLSINFNPDLQMVNFNALQSVGGLVDILSNPQLGSLAGLSNLTTITGRLYINANGALTQIDGLSNLETTEGDIVIYTNPQLANLDGLSNLTSIGGELRIDTNAVLTNLDGLSNLTQIGGQVYINENPALTDISGLANIDPETIENAWGLYIVNNPLLSVCNLPNLCTYLSNPVATHPRTISGNLANCLNETAVTTACSAPCPTGNNFTFTNQQQIDDFGTMYAHCTDIELGDVLIAGSDITNLDGLGNVTATTGFFQISNTSTNLTDITGLSNLTTIGGYLRIIDCPALTNTDGLGNLTTIGGHLYINMAGTPNEQLATIDLHGLTTVGGGIDIRDIQSLTTINLSSLTSVGNDFYIQNNPALTAINLSSPTLTIEGVFSIQNNDALSNLDGLSNLTTLQGSLTIYNNALEDIDGLSNLTTVSGQLGFNVNPALTNLNGLSSLTTTGGLFIGNSNALTNLNGLGGLTTIGAGGLSISLASLTNLDALSGLTAIGGKLEINGNPALNNLNGLSNVTTLGGDLYIRQNASLTNLNGLSNITTVGGYLYIDDNDLFTNLDALNGLTSIGGKIEIRGNALLANLNGLNNVASVQGEIRIGGTSTVNANQQLTDISGLATIDPDGITYLYIRNNPLLSVCNLPNFCTYLSDETNTRTISGNLANCLDETAVTTACSAPCPTGNNYTFTNQQQIDDFGAMYAHCTDIVLNNLTIYDYAPYEITNLDGLSNITGITENLSITDTNLTNFDVFSGLTSIGGTLTINQNTQLANLDGLSNITVAGYLDIASNPVLTDIDGLSNLTSIGGYLYVRSNALLTNIDGLSNIVSIGGGIGISNNPALTDIDALGNITTLGGDFFIFDNDVLTNLDNFNGLTGIGGKIEIRGNALIANLDGLSNVQSVQGEIRIGGPLSTHGNPQLTDISGLQNISPEGITNLYIRYNPLLSVCNLANFCTYLSDETNTRNIQNNAGDCISSQAIEDACAGNCDSYTVWNGTTWSNQAPDIDKKVIIQGDLTLTEDIIACEILLHSGILTINPEVTLTLNGAIENTRSVENIIVKSDANLIQIDDVENMGEITVERESSPMFRLDYTLWSSPVSGMLLKNFSEVSPSGGYGTLWNRVYTLGETAWLQVWQNQPDFLADTTKTFTQAKGYLYRAKNDWVVRGNQNGDPAQEDLGIFKGVPQNGTVNIAAPYLFNAIGNPYPSPVDADELRLDNGADALYFWTNTNVPVGETYTSNNWAAYNATGGTVASNGTEEPDGIIQTGQGFVIGFESANPTRTITFDNTMRLATHNGQFFRQMNNNERHRFWLNLSNDEVVFNQNLVGYLENATQGVDTGIDAKMFAYEGNAIYSLIENSPENYVIQGRELPFTDADMVPLGFRAVNAGSFSISLSNSDGIFEQGNTSIYLKDNFNQTQHNLNDGAYQFLSEEGVFDNRFEVVYQTTMSVENADLQDSNWIVFRHDNGFQIQTQRFDLKEVSVYDMLGRKIYSSSAEGTVHQIPALGAEGVFIVKVITTEDKVLNKKVR